jgi:3-polyprenyl-4-hydroxybenzoate decarboxylase
MPDLRAWLDDVKKIGQLMTVENVHWDLELSTLTEIINERSKTRPAIIFDRIKDYPQGYRVAANLVSSVDRLAMTLGMKPGLGDMGFVQAWREQVKKIAPVKAQTVSSGPLFENTQKGKDINLLQFPVPRWHELDGGRYIGTDDLVITRDPDEGWVNVGTYRIMVHGPDRVALHMSRNAVACTRTNITPREKHCRSRLLSAIIRSTLSSPLRTCRTASTNTIMRAAFSTSRYKWSKVRSPDYRFPPTRRSRLKAKWPSTMSCPRGRSASGRATMRAINRRCRSSRSRLLPQRPILCGFPLLKPSAGDNLHFSLMRSSLIWNALDEAGVPDVKGVWAHPSGGRFLTVLSIKQRYPGHARQAGMIASQCRSGAYLGRYVIVVDDDLDITNSEEVLWVLSSRSEPADSIEILRRAWSGPLDPRIPRDQVGHSSRAVIDATRPYEWREKFPHVSGASRELKDNVANNWRGFLDQKVGGK